MEELIPGAAVVAFKYMATFGGGTLATMFFAKLLGRKKEDVAMALDWQKHSDQQLDLINKLQVAEMASVNDLHALQLAEITNTFKVEIATLVSKVDELIIDKQASARLLKEWELEVEKHKIIINQKVAIISEQEQELEELRNK